MKVLRQGVNPGELQYLAHCQVSNTTFRFKKSEGTIYTAVGVQEIGAACPKCGRMVYVNLHTPVNRQKQRGNQ